MSTAGAVRVFTFALVASSTRTAQGQSTLAAHAARSTSEASTTASLISATPLTVTDAVTLARANHPALAAAGARRRAAVALARQDATFANPVLEWRAENLGSPLERDAFLTVAAPLDLTGRRLALRSSVRAVERRMLADSVSVIRDIEANAARAFWRASLSRALLGLAEDQAIDAERLARLEADRAREGAVAEVAAMRTSMEFERARIAEASARAAWVDARAELARAAGVAPEALPPVPVLTADRPRLAPAPRSDAAIAHALGARSEITALRAAADAANHRLSAERRAFLADVTLQAGSKQTAGYSTRVIGIAVPLPLFNRNVGARDRAAAELDAITAELRFAEQSVTAGVTASLESYRALVDAQPHGAAALAAAATEVASIADGAYAAGGSSLLELLEARRARNETLTTVLRWVADLHIAHIDLLRALGASPLDTVTLP